MDERILIDERLYTKRLYLRSRKLDDNSFVFEATRYDGFNDGMPWNRPESIEEMTEKYYASQNAWINGKAYTFVSVEQATEQRVGMISIRKTDKANVWDIGYWTHPAFQNKGLMTECLSAILEFGFNKLKAFSIEAKYAVWNKASEKVMESNGMKNVEYLEKGFEKNGIWVEEYRMEITRSTWNQLKA
jgi:ribosomal-protein-alanine N-acetyltransferase